MVRLGHSLSDALDFGPLNPEPVYGCRITRVSDDILHRVSSRHMTTPPSESLCAKRDLWCAERREKLIEHYSRTEQAGQGLRRLRLFCCWAVHAVTAASSRGRIVPMDLRLAAEEMVD